jgi:hypothetical protein
MGERPRPTRTAALSLVVAIAAAGLAGFLIARPRTPPSGTPPTPAASTSPGSTRPASIGPASTAGYSVADDPATHQIVVFGGLADNTATWLWDGTRWRLAEPHASPPGRIDAAAAYDPALQVVLLFGGHGPPGTDLSDTWAWGGATWRELDKGGIQPPGSDASMAWDPALNEMVLMAAGPADAATATWTWNQTHWTRLQSGLPSPPTNLALGFDPGLRLLLAVTWDPVPAPATASRMQTWAWDGSAWRRVPTRDAPDAEAVVGLSWDPVSRGLLLFAGGASSLEPVWAWNGTDWMRLRSLVGPPILDGGIVSTADALVLVGALGIGAERPAPITVWRWTGTAWKAA